MNREALHAALAEIAAIGGNWCRLIDGARDDPERMEMVAGVTPRVMAGIMGAAADALESDGVDVATAVDEAVERIGKIHDIEWN